MICFSGEELHVGDLPGLMLEIVDLDGIALLDDFLPSTQNTLT
jgi:hypothetical protein